MSKVVRKKGISLVALVITIIVLIVLTAAVVITGVNVPSNADYAVKMYNKTAVQDAVTIYIMNTMLEGTGEGVKTVEEIVGELYNVASKEWIDNANTKLGINLTEAELQANFTLDNKGVVGWVAGKEPTRETDEENNQQQPTKTLSSIAVSGTYKTEYEVGDTFDNTGLVVTATYSDGSTENVTSSVTYEPTLDTQLATTNTSITVTYEDKSTTVNITVEEVVVALPDWISTSTSLNATTPYVQETINGTTYYAPIPLGFTVVSGTNISTGLVIQDASANQFVWVPVNDSYTMKGDVTGDGTCSNMQIGSPRNFDIPYLSNDTTNALAYWQASANGHTGTITHTGSITRYGTYSEPYSSAGSWETAEYQAMVTSVLNYGGFYVGRYETGKETVEGVNKPVVKAGQSVWNNVVWGSSMTEYGSNTATAISRGMYTSDDYGVVSTLIYGIQWDSIMCWASCYNAMTPATDSVGSTGSVSTDCYKNIYDLAGNMMEWSMEAEDTYASRIRRGGEYMFGYAVSCRGDNGPHVYDSNVGFRTALYVK